VALGIFLNATTGDTDGTLEVPGDASGVTLASIGSVGTFHLRAASGQQNAYEAVTVTAPTNCEVSKDGITFAASVEYAIGAIQDTNVVCYIKRTAGVAAATLQLLTSPRLPLVTEEAMPDTTAPVLSGTLTATPGDTQVTLVGPTATDAVGIAKWQYSIDAGAWVDIAASNNTTMPSTVVGSLTNGTEYSFTVRAVDAATNASSTSNAATATPAYATYWSDDFADGSINSLLWHTDVLAPGAVTESGGNLVAADADGTGKWVLQSVKPMTIGTAQKLTVNGVISSVDGSNYPGLGVSGDDTIYPGDVADNIWAYLQVWISFQTNAAAPDTGRAFWISYWNHVGTRYTWNGGSFNTTVAGTLSSAIVAGAEYSIEFETNASSQWRVKITVGGSVLVTTTWVAFSATRAGTSPRLTIRDTDAVAASSTTYTSASLAAV